MVTVKFTKKELPIESALPANLHQSDFDLHGATTPPARSRFEEPPRPQPVPWWQPITAPAPGPQEDYEAEYQLPPPLWPSSPSAVVKSPDRTIPTTLDRFMIQLHQANQQHQLWKNAAKQDGPGDLGWPPFPGVKDNADADYQMQLELLELQNKTRLQMGRQASLAGLVSGGDWKPGPGWEASLSPDSRQALQQLRETDKIHRTMMRQEEARRARINAQPGVKILTAFDAAPAEYQRQLMLLEAQNKRRLMFAGQEWDAMRQDNALVARRPVFTPESMPGGREQSVDSAWSTQFTPESTPGFPDGAGIVVKVETEPSPGLSPQNSRQYHDSDPPSTDEHRRLDLEMQPTLLAIREQKMRSTVEGQAQGQGTSTPCDARAGADDTEEPDSETGNEDYGPVCVAGGSRAEILHRTPLVIRERRPCCDD